MPQALRVDSTALNDAYHDSAVDLDTSNSNGTQDPPAQWHTLGHLLQTALDQHCEEIHIEPDVNCLRLRYLILGEFQEIRLNTRHELAQSLCWLNSQLPSLQNEQPCRQGWFIFPLDKVRYVFQVDLTMTSWGHSYVISRLFEHHLPLTDLNKLVSQPSQFNQIKTLLEARSGLLLLAGTEYRHRMTMLRAATQLLVSPDRKIVIAETTMHPRIPRTTQMAMPTTISKEDLRSFLHACELSADVVVAPDTRLDPAALIQLANSKALLIQGVMANCASSALAQIIACKVPCEAIAHSLNSVIVQNRIGCLCQECLVPHKLSNAENQWINERSPIRENEINEWLNERLQDRFSTGEGCDACRGTGTAHMTTIIEIIKPNEQLRDALYRRDIRKALRLFSQLDRQSDRLLNLARRGVISLSEAMRLTPE